MSNSAALVFVEMKVDSKCSIDQFAKYAIAAHCIMQDEPQITSVDPYPRLLFLQKHLVPDIQRLPQTLRHFLADGPLAVFHFGNMALRDAGYVGKLPLR